MFGFGEGCAGSGGLCAGVARPAAGEWQRDKRELGESGDPTARWKQGGLAPPTLHYQTTQEGLTAYAGMPLFIGFTQQAGLGEQLGSSCAAS